MSGCGQSFGAHTIDQSTMIGPGSSDSMRSRFRRREAAQALNALPYVSCLELAQDQTMGGPVGIGERRATHAQSTHGDWLVWRKFLGNPTWVRR